MPDDTKSLTYLFAVNPGWLPVWSGKGVEYTHYCANRMRRQFGLDQGVQGSPSETLPQVPSISPFLKDQAFGYWNQSVSRMVILCGGRLGICTVAMQEYWLRVAVAMADYVSQGRGTRVPLLNHHAHPIETVTLSPPLKLRFLMLIDRIWALLNGIGHGVVGFCIAPSFLQVEKSL